MSPAMPSDWCSSAVMRPTRMCGNVHAASAASARPSAGDRMHECRCFLSRDAAFERNPLDFVILQPLDQFGHPLAGLRHRRVGHHQLRADDADRDGRLEAVQAPQDREQPFDVASDERMVGGVELRRAHAGGEAPQAARRTGRPGCARQPLQRPLHSSPASSPRAAARTPRGPRDEAARSASSAAGVPIFRSAAAAAARTRRVRIGAQNSP